ncbi:MAG: hypothetical protein ACRDDX_05245 [Cellulosilyticaceae bacterium]
MRRWLMVGVSLSLILGSVGCQVAPKGNMKKIVIEEDVRQVVGKDMYEVTVEQVDLVMEPGVSFSPTFYSGGEVYGSVRNTGYSDELNFPIDGWGKDKLYRVSEEDTLVETPIQLISYPHRGMHRITEINTDGEKQVLEVDYQNGGTIKVAENLTKVIQEIGGTGLSVNGEFITQEGDKVYIIYRGYDSPYIRYIYFYNETKDKIYSNEEGLREALQIAYIPSLGGFVGIDEKQMLHKIRFHEDKYTLEPYLDLKAYIPVVETTKYTWNIFLDESHLLMLYYEPFIKDKYMLNGESNQFITKRKWNEKTNTYETKDVTISISEIARMGILDLETNQYEELIGAEDTQHRIMNPVGQVATMGGYMFVTDFFEEEDNHLMPQRREIQLIKDGKLETLFAEDIRDEGKTLEAYTISIINEEGTELFVSKECTALKGERFGREETERVIYKRYTFK